MDAVMIFWHRILSNGALKFVLFVCSYLLAVAITVGILTISEAIKVLRVGGDLASALRNSILAVGLSFLGGLLCFPAGLPVGILYWSDPSLSTRVESPLDSFPRLIIGWFAYLVLGVFFISIKNRRVSTIIYIVGVVMLLINIGGCAAYPTFLI
jgi:hypothetical protein